MSDKPMVATGSANMSRNSPMAEQLAQAMVKGTPITYTTNTGATVTFLVTHAWVDPETDMVSFDLEEANDAR